MENNMELSQITFKSGNLIVTVEENSTTKSYSVDIVKEKAPDETHYESVARFRTDEVDLDSLIKALEFVKNYNFIQ